MLAMVVNDDPGSLTPPGALSAIASMLAPTGNADSVGAGLLAMEDLAPRDIRHPASSLTTIATVRHARSYIRPTP